MRKLSSFCHLTKTAAQRLDSASADCASPSGASTKRPPLELFRSPMLKYTAARLLLVLELSNQLCIRVSLLASNVGPECGQNSSNCFGGINEPQLELRRRYACCAANILLDDEIECKL